MKRVPCLAIRCFWMAALLLMATAVAAERFSYHPPGDLIPGSGFGVEQYNVYVPGMRYPVEATPSYANSQVWGAGGNKGPSGGECHPSNYRYPWRDNFCETRPSDRRNPWCRDGYGHQGQDIRGATCEDSKWWTVAAENGTILNFGTFSVKLQGESGILHRYLHLDMSQLAVYENQSVRKGQRIGKISNDFGGVPTTWHLHYEMKSGGRFVPVYWSLVTSYRQLLGANFNSDVLVPLLLED